MTHEIIATCPLGFEPLLAEELKSLSITGVRPLSGQVSFQGTLKDAYLVCLYSRMASRILWIVERIASKDSDELYNNMLTIAWETHIGQGARIAIDAHGSNAELRSEAFIAQRAKDAISDRLMQTRGTRAVVDVKRPDVQIAVRIHNDHAMVAIDLCGEPLFRRGYEAAKSKRAPIAPLRPDYAAALLMHAGISSLNVSDQQAHLAILHVGAGTLAAEALSIMLEKAPGLLRTHFAFESWSQHDQKLWESLCERARKRYEQNLEEFAAAKRMPKLYITDMRYGAEAASRQLVLAAGLPDCLHYFDIHSTAKATKALAHAHIVCDLSWTDSESMSAYAQILSQTASLVPKDAKESLSAIVRDGLVFTLLGLTHSEDQALRTLLGRDSAYLYHFEDVELAETANARKQITLADSEGKQRELAVLSDGAEIFANRLQKVIRQRRKWARAEDISCYRLYDADLPEYAVSIELYHSSELMPPRRGPKAWLQISEYKAPNEVPREKAEERLFDVIAISSCMLGIDAKDIYLHTRMRAKGGSQYTQEVDAQKSERLKDSAKGGALVDEGGLTFELHFDARLDCGLFLDHRDTRSMIRELAKQTKGSKRFLNLFAYTGSATCYAADGGAKFTTTVDMSAPTLEWAKRNMARNGFEGENHEYIQADVIRWISDMRKTKNRWDLVFCDVPTFSNSKRMGRNSFDVQRDHSELLIGVSRVLTRDGVCIFSCNLRGFKPDVEKLNRLGVAIEDITDETIPEDFDRGHAIHKCYRVTRMPREDAENNSSRDKRRAPNKKPYRDTTFRQDRRPGGTRKSATHTKAGTPQRDGMRYTKDAPKRNKSFRRTKRD